MTETPLKHQYRPQRGSTGCRMCGQPENDGRHWAPAWVKRAKANELPVKDYSNA